MPKPILYCYETNAPSRFVMMLAKEIGLDMEYRPVNLMKKEQFKPEFTKINPMHQIPTLDDNGVIVWDAHAICTYLVTKYAKNDKLYPKDIVMKTQVDERLYFDGSYMYAKLLSLMEPIFYYETYEIPQYKMDNIEKCYDYVETMFKNNSYIVGNHMTLADLAYFATIANMIAVVPMVYNKYPKITAWYKSMCQLPYYKEFNQHGADEFKKYFFEFVEKNQKGMRMGVV